MDDADKVFNPDDDKYDPNVSERQFEDYKKYLEGDAQQEFIKKRETIIVQSLQEKLDVANLNVRSVSAGKYSATLSRRATVDWTADESRIPRLREYSLTLTSTINSEDYRKSCFETVPDAINRIANAIKKYENDEGYAKTRRKIMEKIKHLGSVMNNEWNTCITAKLPQAWAESTRNHPPVTQAINKIQAWSKLLTWSTFDKVMRDGGIPINSKAKAFEGRCIVNLNYDISEQMLEAFEEWKNLLEQNTEAFTRLLEQTIADVNGEVCGLMDCLRGNDALRHQATAVWAREKDKINRLIAEKLPAQLKKAAENTHKLTTMETDSETLIAELNAALYLKASQVLRGSGLHKRQMKILTNGLEKRDRQGKAFADRLQDAVVEIAERELQHAYDGFTHEVLGIYEGFARIMGDFLFTTSEYTRAELEMREQLGELCPWLYDEVKEIQRLYKLGGGHEDREDERQLVKKAKSN